ncbi:LacI family transcriptional regulator [Nonomuraea sp. MG754425]|uniref:LacI family DNA-binding transcriptional regulator n=1 Tax=Nonomuraea sp. MG754425 TaxID=2570319 RepID=UPI001F4445C1|nr:LacI family DNA-binding transcriptional regulator [Nonomuraea sp. MG754425]MCF6475419.1 LacI family transcriptional regulator [Nonomuraea sp. MG754425]
MSTRRARPTIRDVATQAGVSMTTVSAVVNSKGRVDPATRERVLTAVSEVGWRPRRSARALRSGQTGVFAMCLPVGHVGVGDWLVNAEYDMALVAACAAATVDSERQLLVAPRPKDVTDLVRLDVDGVIIADPREGDQALTVLNNAGVPAVTIDRDVQRTDGWWVETDNEGSTMQVLDHLAERGARRIALVTADAPWAWFEDTSAAYERWCAGHGVKPLVRLIDVERPRATAAAGVRGLLRLKNPPDAIFAIPYGTPLGALDAIVESGRSVPGDVLLAGGMDGQLMQGSSPPITAVDLRPLEMARAAVDLLARRVNGEQAAGPVVVETALRIRASTAGRETPLTSREPATRPAGRRR